MPFQIIRNDITRVAADAIVNSAAPKPLVGLGTDYAIHKAAGPELLEARKKIGDIQTGQSFATPAFQLQAKYVLHTVSPVWIDGRHGEEEDLRNYLDGRHDPELWTLETVGRRELLLYASETRKMIRMDRFGAAFNARDYGLLCALSSPEAREELVESLWFWEEADDPHQVFETLYHLYGPLSPGYIRTDRTAFRKILCWGDKLCISLGYDADGKISAINFRTQDESYHELIVLDEVCPPHPLNVYPRLAGIRFLPPSEHARFCMRLIFNNGEEKLHQFKCTAENDEIALIEGYCFTDRIFQNGKLAEPDEETAKDKSDAGFFRGQRVEFANGFSVTTAELYFESEEIYSGTE